MYNSAKWVFPSFVEENRFQLKLAGEPQIREQMSVPDLYVVTMAFLALKKTGFSEIKFFSKIFFEKF